MRFAMFYHSLVSDWNHGNAHFLRGVAEELQARGHQVTVYQPRDGWSLRQLYRENPEAVHDFYVMFPQLKSHFYDPAALDLEEQLDDVDVVIVHEWNDPDLVAAIGRHCRGSNQHTLLFHDTHHRSATAPEEMCKYDLSDYDGVLAFGEVIRQIYLDNGWASRVWTWHEAADTSLFRPAKPNAPKRDDLVWIGNWGDGERSDELTDYLIEPVRSLALRAAVHGVRYPASGRTALENAGIEFRGWIPNYRVPEAFAQARMTVHIPRRPYREQLPGIPTIRVFEALACGIPLVCLRWEDCEHLFRPGEDYLQADNPREMQECLHALASDAQVAAEVSTNGLRTVLSRHTCAHRVDELMEIVAGLRARLPETHQEEASSRRESTEPIGVSLP